MAEKKRGIYPVIFTALIVWVVAVVLASVLSSAGMLKGFCMLDSICFSGDGSPFWEAIKFGSAVTMLLAALYIGFTIAQFAITRFEPIALGAWTLVAVGIVGVVVFIAVSSREEILRFIHIIVIGSLLSGFGAFMLIKTAKGNAKHKRKTRK